MGAEPVRVGVGPVTLVGVAVPAIRAAHRVTTRGPAGSHGPGDGHG